MTLTHMEGKSFLAISCSFDVGSTSIPLRRFLLVVGLSVSNSIYIIITVYYYGQQFALSFSLLSILDFFDFSASNIPFFTQQGIEIGIRVRGFILPKYYNLMLVSYIAYWIYRLQICKFFSIYTN